MFIHNYGLELRTNYPYRGHADTCPYDDNTDPKTMGYIRMDSGSIAIIPIEMFEEYIEYSPILIEINAPSILLEYGGGIYDGNGCKPEPNHAVLLIGHGREDGQEYWLIRNSLSVGCGDEGHLKLAKSSDCIQPKIGLLYGTNDGIKYPLDVGVNERSDKNIIKRYYERHIPWFMASIIQ